VRWGMRVFRCGLTLYDLRRPGQRSRLLLRVAALCLALAVVAWGS